MRIKLFLFGILVAAVTIFVMGCGSDDKGTNNTGPVPVTAEIGPDGGTIEIAGKISLTVVPGALADTVDFSIVQKSSPTPPGGNFGFVSPAYTIEPSGTDFTLPCSLTIYYDPALLGGGDESTVKLYTWSGGNWIAVDTLLDEASNTISGRLLHLSDYAAIGNTGSGGEGVYAKLVVGRNISYYGVLMRIDQFVASLDSTYAPCDPIHPISNAVITCGGNTLTWEPISAAYAYPAIPFEAFLQLGASYTYVIQESSDVPALTQGITFPSAEPHFEYMSITLNRSQANTINWTGAGAGTVEIVITSDVDSVYFAEVANTGSYTIPAGELSGNDAGTYFMTLNHYNRQTISAQGYDERSFIAARVMSNATVILE